MEHLEGYSVAKRGEAFIVYRGDQEVARISSLGPFFNNRLGFDWHDRFMWKFRTSDFVICASVNQAQR